MKKLTIISSIVFILSALPLYLIWMFGNNFGPGAVGLIGVIAILVFVALVSLLVLVVSIVFSSQSLILRITMAIIGAIPMYFLSQGILNIFIADDGSTGARQTYTMTGLISAIVIGILLLIFAIRKRNA